MLSFFKISSSAFLFITLYAEKGLSKYLGVSNRSLYQSNRCINGPYFFDDHEPIEDYEGIAHQARKLTIGFMLSEAFGLRYIANSLWFKSSHATHYQDMFDYHSTNIGDCTEEDVVRNKSLRIVDIIYKPTESQRSADLEFLGKICELHKTGVKRKRLGFKSFGRFNFSSSFLGTSALAAVWDRAEAPVYLKSTVFRLYRKYEILETRDHSCLTRLSWNRSFWRKKKIDISLGIKRYELPIECLTIGYAFRAGDLFYVIGGFTADFDAGAGNFNWPMNMTINLIHNLFRLKTSILKDFDIAGGCYKIQFFSEHPYYGDAPLIEHSKKESEELFHEILEAFPPGIVELRVNHTEHLVDFDMILSADILILGKNGFHEFLRFLPHHSTVIIADEVYGNSKLLEKIPEDYKGKELEDLLRLFNKALCRQPRHRVSEIHYRCARAGLLTLD